MPTPTKTVSGTIVSIGYDEEYGWWLYSPTLGHENFETSRDSVLGDLLQAFGVPSPNRDALAALKIAAVDA